MVIALLGLGNVGKAVFKIICSKKKDLKIKYVLVKDKAKHQDVDSTILTSNYQDIISDNEVDVIIEMMGAKVSYEYIKMALNNGKHVITANKEVIAAHYVELQSIALSKKVNLLFEASVGGGIPIINSLLNSTDYNNITEISGILNGTTNFILTSMHKEKMSFEEALKKAQVLGFAEADPTADLEGLDMMRKIAILSMIAYKTEIDLNTVYHYGIKNVTKDIVEIIELLGYKLKFVATSRLNNDKINICVEPVIIKADETLANIDYEYNFVSYLGDNCGSQSMVGKGAGPVTANSIIFDLNLLINNYKQTFMPVNKIESIGKTNFYAKYFIKSKKKIASKYVEKNFKEFVLTKRISNEDFLALKDDISFYARILND